jgi:ATP-binding cassette subfamily F protein uup
LLKGRMISASQLLERFLLMRKKQYDFVIDWAGGARKRTKDTDNFLSR